MVRTQIQLTEEQHRGLHQYARKLGISLSEAIRRSVGSLLASQEAAPTRAELVREALAVCGKYTDPRGQTRVAREHDRHLAEAYSR